MAVTGRLVVDKYVDLEEIRDDERHVYEARGWASGNQSGVELIDANYGKKPRRIDKHGNIAALGAKRGKKRRYGAAVNPGPNEQGEYEIDTIYDAEDVIIEENGVTRKEVRFAVEWRGWSRFSNSLEPLENVGNCRALNNYLKSKKLITRIGATTRSTGIRAISPTLIKSSKPIGDDIECLMAYRPEEVPDGLNEYDVIAMDLFRRYGDAKFWHPKHGFWSVDKPLVVLNSECSYLKELAAIWTLKHDHFILYNKTLGPMPSIISKFDKNFSNSYRKNVKRIAEEWKPLLVSGKGVVGFMATQRGAGDAALDIHSRIMVVNVIDNIRSFYLFDCDSQSPTAHSMALQLISRLRRPQDDPRLHLAGTAPSDYKDCYMRSIRFAATVFANNDWTSKFN